jgi:hypothetical protein
MPDMNDIEMKLRMSNGSLIEMAADDEAHHKICFKKNDSWICSQRK